MVDTCNWIGVIRNQRTLGSRLSVDKIKATAGFRGYGRLWDYKIRRPGADLVLDTCGSFRAKAREDFDVTLSW